MAYGGGTFGRAESQYVDPGRYKEEIQRGGAEKAAYLSAMDKFYAELEQEKTQFGERMALEREKMGEEEERWEEELAWLREQQAGGFEEAGREREFKSEMAREERAWAERMMAEEDKYAEMYGGGAGGGAGGGGGMGSELMRLPGGGVMATTREVHHRGGYTSVEPIPALEQANAYNTAAWFQQQFERAGGKWGEGTRGRTRGGGGPAGTGFASGRAVDPVPYVTTSERLENIRGTTL